MVKCVWLALNGPIALKADQKSATVHHMFCKLGILPSPSLRIQLTAPY